MSAAEQSAQLCGVIQAASVDASVLTFAPIVLTMGTSPAIAEQVVATQTNEFEQPAAQLVVTTALDQSQNVAPEPISEETIAAEQTGIARSPEEGTAMGSGHPGSSTAVEHPGTTTTTALPGSEVTEQTTATGVFSTSVNGTTATAQLDGVTTTPKWTPRDTKNRPHECKICGKRLTAKKHLVTHMKRIHEKLKPYECPDCKRCFAANGDLTRHRSTVHVSDRLHKCTICEKAFKTDELLRKHCREVHTDDRQHRCHDCNKAYKTERSLRKHLGIVHGKATFSFQQCELCGVRVSGQRALIEHQRTVHEKLEPHQCDECGKKFKRKSQVNRHRLSVHALVKPHKCTICEKTFAVKAYLSRHLMSVHWNGEDAMEEGAAPVDGNSQQTGGEEPMEVGASFVQEEDNQGEAGGGSPSEQANSEQLATTAKRHPFASHPCDDCNKVLKSRELLRQHQAVVHGKGKFHQCADCGIRVRGQSALHEHQMAVHGKQKPNQCPDCGKHFTRKRDVKRHHMIVHLKKKPHQCNKCDKMFSRKADLTKHEESHKTQEQTVDQSAMEMAAQETTQQETSADAQQQAPTSAPVTEEVTRSMESLVDLLVLASEINAGFSGTVGVGVEAKEALLHIQNTVPEHHEEVILESGIQPTSAVTQSTGTAADVNASETQTNQTSEGNVVTTTTTTMDSEGADQPPEGDPVEKDKSATSKEQTMEITPAAEGKSIDVQNGASDRSNNTVPVVDEAPENTTDGKPDYEPSSIKKADDDDDDKTESEDSTAGANETESSVSQTVHNTRKLHQCPDCKKTFKVKESLRKHLATVHGKGKFEQCPDCGMRFAGRGALDDHQRAVHDQERANKCDECGKMFSRNRDMKRHKAVVHLKIKPHKCTDCEKSFSKKADLIKHVESNHGKKELDQGTTEEMETDASLQKEQSTDETGTEESEQDVLQCSDGNQHFSDESALQEHCQEVHSKQTSYQCDECGKKFWRKRDFQRHSTLHHTTDNYKCSDCDKAYTKMAMLSRHIKAVHKKDDEGTKDSQQMMEMDDKEVDLPEGFADEIEAGPDDDEQLGDVDPDKGLGVSNLWGSSFYFRSSKEFKASRRKMSSGILKKVRRAPMKESSAVRSQKACRIDNIALTLARNQTGENSEQ